MDEVNVFKLALKIMITEIIGLLISGISVIILTHAFRLAFGTGTLSETPFLVFILFAGSTSFIFVWWLDKRIRIHKIVSRIVDKMW
jgi:hypothetical protein